jgi:hypothetical protein
MGVSYLTIEQVARKVGTTSELVEEQIAQGRVQVTRKNGRRFLSDQEVYKLSFVLYLQNERRLSPEQIERVLQKARPPYTSWQQDSIASEPHSCES